MFFDNPDGLLYKFFIKRGYCDFAWLDLNVVSEHAVIAFGEFDKLAYAQFEQLVVKRLGNIVVRTKFKSLYGGNRGSNSRWLHE